MSSSDLGYAAGLFDGEGSVSIIVRRREGKKPFHEMFAQVSMVRREALDFLSERWGGKVYTWKGNGRAYYKWCIYTARARQFLQDIYPLIQIKTVAIDLALSLVNTSGFDEREKVRLALKQENARRPLWYDQQ